jgi:hypothetical protein
MAARVIAAAFAVGLTMRPGHMGMANLVESETRSNGNRLRLPHSCTGFPSVSRAKNVAINVIRASPIMYSEIPVVEPV